MKPEKRSKLPGRNAALRRKLGHLAQQTVAAVLRL